jgi:hypothetical protein
VLREVRHRKVEPVPENVLIASLGAINEASSRARV